MSAVEDRRAKVPGAAVRELAGSALTSRRAVSDRLAEAQKCRMCLSRDFFESAIGNLKTQAERNLDVSEELVEQARRGQEAAQRVLARESARAYGQFLDSLFFYYRESVRVAEKSDGVEEQRKGDNR